MGILRGFWKFSLSNLVAIRRNSIVRRMCSMIIILNYKLGHSVRYSISYIFWSSSCTLTHFSPASQVQNIFFKHFPNILRLSKWAFVFHNRGFANHFVLMFTGHSYFTYRDTSEHLPACASQWHLDKRIDGYCIRIRLYNNRRLAIYFTCKDLTMRIWTSED